MNELVVDLRREAVSLDGADVHLSGTEFDLLAHAARTPDRCIRKDEFLRVVWNYESPSRTRTVDTTVCRLRSKLGGNGFFRNLHGRGYVLARDASMVKLRGRRPTITEPDERLVQFAERVRDDDTLPRDIRFEAFELLRAVQS